MENPKEPEQGQLQFRLEYLWVYRRKRTKDHDFKPLLYQTTWSLYFTKKSKSSDFIDNSITPIPRVCVRCPVSNTSTGVWVPQPLVPPPGPWTKLSGRSVETTCEVKPSRTVSTRRVLRFGHWTLGFGLCGQRSSYSLEIFLFSKSQYVFRLWHNFVSCQTKTMNLKEWTSLYFGHIIKLEE